MYVTHLPVSMRRVIELRKGVNGQMSESESQQRHSPVEGAWPVLVRPPPLVEEEAPFQNT
jgi:hypothetical protein